MHHSDQYQFFPDSPPLFKAQDKTSNQNVYFEDMQQACEWIVTHPHWILKKCETINWTFPLEKIIAQECWVKIEYV